MEEDESVDGSYLPRIVHPVLHLLSVAAAEKKKVRRTEEVSTVVEMNHSTMNHRHRHDY
jgi:hypothetical protein